MPDTNGNITATRSSGRVNAQTKRNETNAANAVYIVFFKGTRPCFSTSRKISCAATNEIADVPIRKDQGEVRNTSSNTSGISTTAVATRFMRRPFFDPHPRASARGCAALKFLSSSCRRHCRLGRRSGVRAFDTTRWLPADGVRGIPATDARSRRSRRMRPAIRENCSGASRRWCG